MKEKKLSEAAQKAKAQHVATNVMRLIPEQNGTRSDFIGDVVKIGNEKFSLWFIQLLLPLDMNRDFSAPQSIDINTNRE